MMRFSVIVADNFHYMDESETYLLDTFETLQGAIDASKRIVDKYLASAYTPGMTADALYESYVMFGEDPCIVCAELEGVPFSAWAYAKEQSKQICDARSGEPG